MPEIDGDNGYSMGTVAVLAAAGALAVHGARSLVARKLV